MSKAEAGGISTAGTVGAFFRKGACSETLLHVINRAFDHPMTEEEHASSPLAGGILLHGYQCGMLWGATLAAGAHAYRALGAGPRAETGAIRAARRLVESFRAQNGHINCLELTEIDRSSSSLQLFTHFFLKGGTIRCFRMAARYAPAAFREIEGALCEEPAEAPPGPVSCSALLARKMGASEIQTVMAAGLAGGIGLSGGACGALGAAIWILGMGWLEEAEGKIAYDKDDPRILEVIEKFLKCTDYEFECATIVGRKFESIGDHASHVCSGGCSRIVEALAATRSSRRA